MNLYIPRIGDQIKLIRDWSFKNQQEYRNNDFLKHYWDYSEAYAFDDIDDVFSDLVSEKLNLKSGEKLDVIIPRGTVLKFSRVYIRQGTSSGWDSVTFTIVSCPIKQLKGRFWVKVHDANLIHYEKVGSKELLAPTISFDNVSNHYDKKGAAAYFYSDEDVSALVENPVKETAFKVKINDEKNYFTGIIKKEYDADDIQYWIRHKKHSNDHSNDQRIAVKKIQFLIFKDLVEVGKATSISGLRKKVKDLFIADHQK